jgi:catechol 2,3-dioxygenase-like lactoylglutathione lyase family enzyme
VEATSKIIGSPSELAAQSVVEVVVPDLPSALSFYRRLGFSVERETPDFVTLRWDSVLLFLSLDDSVMATPRWVGLRIIVPDVNAVWAHVQLAQLTVRNPIGDRPYGLRDFTVQDPAGFDVRFAQILAPASNTAGSSSGTATSLSVGAARER